ncbi:MAG: DoxX family protein [Proteobacteria bacterium]|nr:DoxX family protein [Pseudomonadota bacterium]
MNNPFNSDAFGKLVLRLTLGVLMAFHGISKLMNPARTLETMSGLLAAAGLPTYLAYGVFIGEVLAPILIILGIYSRIGGLIVVINMVFAVLLAHPAQLLALTKTGGWALELQGFYLLTGLALLFLGSGRIAVKPD